MDELLDPTNQKKLKIMLDFNDVDEVTDQVENLLFEDLSLDLEPKADEAKETIIKTLVSKFFVKSQSLIACYGRY